MMRFSETMIGPLYRMGASSGGYVKPIQVRGLLGLGADVAPLRFEMRGSVAKPKDSYTLGVYQGLQRVLNVWALAYGLRAISVDGDIGPATLSLTKQVLGVATVSSGTGAPFGPSSILLSQIDSVSKLATMAGSIGAALANLRSVPFNTGADPSKRAPTDPPLDDRIVAAPPAPPSSGGFNWPLVLGAVALGGGLLLWRRRNRRS